METAADRYSNTRRNHWDKVARTFAHKGMGGFYHERLNEIYRFLVPPGQRVIEIGCSEGDLLAAVEPEHGVGIDFSPEMIARAEDRHPQLRMVCADAHTFQLDEAFDVVIMSDLVNDLWDVQTVLDNLKPLCGPDTRLIINTYSHLWQLPLEATRKLGLARPNLPQNWLTVEDLVNLLGLADFETVRCWSEILLPLRVSGLHKLCNRYLVKFWPFRLGALTNFIIARPRPAGEKDAVSPTVSVVVAARNEAGNVPAIFKRVPEMGGGTELVFVEGHSRDGTYEAIADAIAKNPHRRCKLFRQDGEGKGNAVRLGFAEADGDILMILDADLTVPPEDLPRFYEALVSGKGEFVNGVRLVYPMHEKAMRFLNLVGNKFFSLAFSWLLGQSIKDTLCGTKVLQKKHYLKIAANRSYFGDFDPFGDFDLIFGAAKLNLKIVDLPIRYRERTYGSTNIQRWRHGILLLRMVLFALKKIKFT